jgi:hypothetical protein
MHARKQSVDKFLKNDKTLQSTRQEKKKEKKKEREKRDRKKRQEAKNNENKIIPGIQPRYNNEVNRTQPDNEHQGDVSLCHYGHLSGMAMRELVGLRCLAIHGRLMGRQLGCIGLRLQARLRGAIVHGRLLDLGDGLLRAGAKVLRVASVHQVDGFLALQLLAVQGAVAGFAEHDADVCENAQNGDAKQKKRARLAR